VYIAGVYNLNPNGDFEMYRARFPGLAAMDVEFSGGMGTGDHSSWADEEALDMANAVFLRRANVSTTNVLSLSSSCTRMQITQKTYAHRKRLGLLVTEFEVDATRCPGTIGLAYSASKCV
jgi:hypothetical protein